MIKKLVTIQSKLKAPKNQNNSFGKYKYRSCEDILEAVKPLVHAEGLILTISDEIVLVGDRVYIKATVTLSDGDKQYSVSAFAREAEKQSGMAEAQCTGASSSYARKYALNGMFCIDDTKDDDATNKHGKAETREMLNFEQLVVRINKSKNVPELKNVWKKYSADIQLLHKEDIKAITEVKNRVKGIFTTQGGSE